MFGFWSLGQKAALSRHFSTFFQLRSPAMRLQKGKKLTKNSLFLTQAPNPKHALKQVWFFDRQHKMSPNLYICLRQKPPNKLKKDNGLKSFSLPGILEFATSGAYLSFIEGAD
jgi:hypothetical protein